MGTIFEELIRRFNEEAGEHWTPRDVVELMGDMVFSSVSDKIKNSTCTCCTCCDGACGTGGMLTVAQERLTALAKANGKKVSIHLVGREILDPRFNAAIGACPHAPKWTNQALKERLRQCPHPDVKTPSDHRAALNTFACRRRRSGCPTSAMRPPRSGRVG